MASGINRIFVRGPWHCKLPKMQLFFVACEHLLRRRPLLGRRRSTLVLYSGVCNIDIHPLNTRPPRPLYLYTRPYRTTPSQFHTKKYRTTYHTIPEPSHTLPYQKIPYHIPDRTIPCHTHTLPYHTVPIPCPTIPYHTRRCPHP